MSTIVRRLRAAFLLSSLLAVSTNVAGTHAVSARATASHATVYVWDPFAIARNDRERATLQRVVAAWEAKTGNSVTLLGNTGSNALRLCSDGPAGKAPDLIAVTHDQLSALRRCGVVRPVPATTWPRSARAGYLPAAVQAVTAGGQGWGMPWSIQTSALFYNTSLVPRGIFGLRPTQWSAVIKQAQRFPIRRPRFTIQGLVWDASNFLLDYGILSAAGGYVFKYGPNGFQRNALGVDSAGSIAGLQLIRDLTNAGKYRLVAGALGDVKAKDLFAAGKAAMYITGSWDVPLFEQLHLPFSVAPMPALGKRSAHPFATVQLFVLNRYSGHRAQALSLLRYMTERMQLPEFVTAQQLPVREDLLSSYTVRKSPAEYALGQAARSAEAVPNIAAMSQVWGPMNGAVSAVATGRASPASAARRAAAQIRAGMRLAGS